MRKHTLLVVALSLVVFVLACGTSSEVATTIPEVIEQASETKESQPDPTAIPATQPPAETEAPTVTPEPTETPIPTDTPEPTPPPDPIAFEGNGDDILDVDYDFGPAIVHITGNAAGRHFAVKNLDANNDTIELLVNTTDPYDGYRPLDWMDGELTTRFEVSADGGWTIEIIPITPETVEPFLLTVPGTYEGNGDMVVFISGTPDVATIKGNSAGRHFAVKDYNGGRDLLVNTTDPYDGKVLVDKDAVALEITGVGDWSITIE